MLMEQQSKDCLPVMQQSFLFFWYQTGFPCKGEVCLMKLFPVERQKIIFIVLRHYRCTGSFNCGLNSAVVSPPIKPFSGKIFLREGFAQIAISQCSCMINNVYQWSITISRDITSWSVVVWNELERKTFRGSHKGLLH